jgi:glycosyltransferase involved in cell wall biosynthesis
LKILHTVQGYAPYVGGSEEVVRRVSERLVRMGHKVTVFTSHHPDRTYEELGGVRVRSFKARGNQVEGLQGEVDEYVRAVVEGGFDVVMNYAAQTWSTDALLPKLDAIRAKKILAPCGYSGLRWPKYRGYFEKLHESLRAYDLLIYHSAITRDKAYGDEHGLSRWTVVPNFADEEEFARGDGGRFRARYGLENRPLCLTVSNHFRAKGHGTVIRAFRKSGIDGALAIVGNSQRPMNVLSDCTFGCRVASIFHGVKLFEGLPREEVVDAFHAADLFLLGSKVECSPLVLFESMAAATPWISTDVGNARELPGGRIANSVEEMAAAIRELVGGKGEELGRAGQQAWSERFTLSKVAPQYEASYQT